MRGILVGENRLKPHVRLFSSPTDIATGYQIEYLTQLFHSILACLDDPTHKIRQAAACYGLSDGTDIQFICNKFLAFDLETVSELTLHDVCEKVVASYKEDDFRNFFDGLRDSTKLIRKDKSRVQEIRQQRPVLMSDFENAFKYEYRNERAIKAFEEYLDRRWLTMSSGVDDDLREDSYCGTIVQSSCSGKSRLVDQFFPIVFSCADVVRIGKHVLSPNVSLEDTLEGSQKCFPPGVYISHSCC
jgi:hypothetical protein